MGAYIAEPGGHRDAVFGLARRAGSILMVRNPRVAKGRHTSLWDLPGGAVDAGESLPEALAREWREETGLDVDVGDLFLVGDGSKQRSGGPVLYTWRAFFFHATSGEEPQAGDGIDEVAWIPEAEVSTRLDAPYHEPLRAWFSGDARHYAPIRWVEAEDNDGRDSGVPRDLLILAAAAAVGDVDLLRAQTARALDGSETVARIEETLLQIVPYAGYPRAITAFGAVRALLGAPQDAGGGTEEDGPTIFERVYGDTTPTVRAGLESLHPQLAAWTLEHAYGGVLARAGVLTLLERELLAVSILTALGGLADPLLGHMRAAKRLGASADDVAAAVQVVPVSVGAGKREAARALLERL